MKIDSLVSKLVSLKQLVPAVLLLGAVSLGLAPAAKAQLVLNVDATTKTFWFTGSTTGTPADRFGDNWLETVWWTSGGPHNNNFDQVSYTSTDLLSSTDGSFSTAELTVGENSYISVYLSRTYNPTEETITGLGNANAYSYASFSSNNQLFLESLTSVPLSMGTGFGNISVVVTASTVPEPSTYAAIFGLAALGFAAYRRRQKAVPVATT